MQKYLSCAMDIGEQLLLNGAEVHRVEDSIRRMCFAFGFERTDVFIITSSMVVTVFKGEDSLTQTRRITTAATDIEKIHRLNDLSRKICNKAVVDLSEIQAEFDIILKQKMYPLWVECLAYAVISGAFSLFFGGNLSQAIVSLIIGILVRLLMFFTDWAKMNKMFIKFICCFFATIFAMLSVKIGLIHSVDKVIIGNIMTLIPGVGLTNSLRDLFTGDSIAGLLRFIEAVLTALAIAAGYFVAAFVFGGLI